MSTSEAQKINYQKLKPQAKTLVMVTACSRFRRPVLANSQTHEALRMAWLRANAWSVGRYLILPNHLHLFAEPNGEFDSLHRWISTWQGISCEILGEQNLWQSNFWARVVGESEGYEFVWNSIIDKFVRSGVAKDLKSWAYHGEINELSR